MKKTLDFKKNTTLITGVGSALVDILLQEGDDFMAATRAAKGGMSLVDASAIEAILSRTNKASLQVPGGSACNTIIGIGALSGTARFIGKRGNDRLGRMLERSLIEQHVEPVLALSDLPTGRVLSIITPDAQRTMFTYLGASSQTRPEDISVDLFRDTALVHLEGYLLFNESLMYAALNAAKEAGCVVSLDLASFTVVEAKRAVLSAIIPKFIDIILANEDEARAFTGISDEHQSLELLGAQTPVAAVKMGKRGSLVWYEQKEYTFGIKGDGSAIDTTGAGDLWASGFLYGLVHHLPIEACGAIAAACGYEVCQVIGAHIPAQGWERIKAQLTK